MGKRFLFGVVAIICVSAVSIMCKYSGDIYFKLVGTITGIFIAGQTVTDTIKKRGG